MRGVPNFKLTMGYGDSTIISVDGGVFDVEEEARKINGKDVSDFMDSYTLRWILEYAVSNFYKLEDKEKKNLCINLDKEFSEKFDMPTANFVFESNELVLDAKNIYFGKMSDVNSGIELIARYLFEKRQQFQRICIIENDFKDYSENDFVRIRMPYRSSAVSKTVSYKPYSSGLKKYVMNYNKVDALIFMQQNMIHCLEAIDYTRVASSMSFIDSLKTSASIMRMQRQMDKIFSKFDSNILDGVLDNMEMYILKSSERVFLLSLEVMLQEKKVEEGKDKRMVFFCFHENVWDNLDRTRREQAVDMCNELLGQIIDYDYVKNVSFDYGKNSYDFTDSENVYVGDVEKELPRSMLQKMIYEYIFCKHFQEMMKMNDKEKEKMLKEYEKCKDIYLKTGDYSAIKDYLFIKCVRRDAVNLQKEIYDYISKNLYIDEQKIKMPITRDEFILDMYKPKSRR